MDERTEGRTGGRAEAASAAACEARLTIETGRSARVRPWDLCWAGWQWIYLATVDVKPRVA